MSSFTKLRYGVIVQNYARLAISSPSKVIILWPLNVIRLL